MGGRGEGVASHGSPASIDGEIQDEEVFQSSWLAGIVTKFELIQDLVFRKVESHS